MIKKVSTMLLFLTLLFSGFSYANVQDELLALMGTMSGQVYVDGNPASYSLVAFFDISKGLPPVGSGFARLPDIVGRTDGEGNFQSKLMGGQYYMGILPRAEDEPIGPPRPGEKFYFASDDQKRLRKLSLEDKQVVDVGQVKGLRRPEILLDEDIGDYFTVEGIIVDGDSDKPYPGARVLAKKNADHGKPDFFGPPTGIDGKFSIKLPVGAPLFLIAREGITGYKPGPGDKIGTYGVNSPAGVANSTLSGDLQDSTPSGVKKRLDISNTDVGMTVSGNKGQVLSGLTIHMYDIPDHQENQENDPKQSGAMLK